MKIGKDIYNVLNDNINYTHEIHLHGGGDFGQGSHQTSHIENYWAQFKKLIMRIIKYLKEIKNNNSKC